MGLNEEKDEIEDYESNRSFLSFNRGNKLKRHYIEQDNNCYKSFKPSLLSSNSLNFNEVSIINKKKNLANKKIKLDPDNDPYYNINIEEIFNVPEKIEDIKNHKPSVSILRSRQLKVIYYGIMSMIEKEKVKLNKLIDLCNMLQGDTVQYVNYEIEEKIPHDKLMKLRELAQENLNCGLEYVKNLKETRNKILQAYLQKKTLAKKYCPFNLTNDVQDYYTDIEKIVFI
ncbi:hypothetical protein H8356DRAFT_1699565 [Neocallimastix lanati (nom. inval.)]|uniref:Transcriptional regulatory protein RXT2 N-terminal domain-containing protein n=1 Tax=Neocallimastix californiae TaxID=1754190 RepID=A0A1Y2ELX4_9FUNG|nr:hypothetical protein H8356DRAFT_1699565 [Neocallimastix sp. JGI-2020a]ORY72509.1 hypothetical protein LY90DRAFT_699972 [Neocallimastix californiae]|eukprot:ORY72509.1 hypothetical protein LY90DRAFT_699972 [Neocallimastix californiae]